MEEQDFIMTNHRCEEMPRDAHLFKTSFNADAQIELVSYVSGSHMFTTTIYGVMFCPYCGEKVVE